MASIQIDIFFLILSKIPDKLVSLAHPPQQAAGYLLNYAEDYKHTSFSSMAIERLSA